MYNIIRKYTAGFMTQPENKRLCLKHIFVNIIQVTRFSKVAQGSIPFHPVQTLQELNSLLCLKLLRTAQSRATKAFIHANPLLKSRK